MLAMALLLHGGLLGGMGAKRLGSTGLGRVLGPSRLQRRASSLLQGPVSLLNSFIYACFVPSRAEVWRIGWVDGVYRCGRGDEEPAGPAPVPGLAGRASSRWSSVCTACTSWAPQDHRAAAGVLTAQGAIMI